jgi:hypothetical protein
MYEVTEGERHTLLYCKLMLNFSNILVLHSSNMAWLSKRSDITRILVSSGIVNVVNETELRYNVEPTSKGSKMYHQWLEMNQKLFAEIQQ